ncbi:MAG: beta strand repeat-containing protein, partial [Limisphaerales bacterium]
NRPGNGRGTPAYYDDVRVYTGAADTNFLENVRQSAFPDPYVLATTITLPTAIVGDAVTLSAIAYGSQPISFQWQHTDNNNVTSLIPGATSSTYTIPSVQFSDAGTYSLIVSNNPAGVPTVVTNTSATLTVRASADTLAWLGALNFNWDSATANWSNTVTTTAGVLYQDRDNVQFTDAGTNSSPISLTTQLFPSSILVSSSSNYTFAGSGNLAGTTSLTKSGTGTLTINNANNFTGSTIINNGILQLGNASALGAANNSVTVNDGGTLDVHGIASPASLQYNIQGSGYTNAGAIVNFGGGIQNGNGIHGLNLLGDATIGGSGRMDLYGTSGSTGLRGNNYNLTKVGTGSVFFIDGGTNNQLEDITILNGTIGFQGTNDLGDPTKTISVLGGSLAFYGVDNDIALNKNIALSNAFFNNAGGNLALNTPITLIGTNTQSAGYQETSSMADTFNGPISGTGGLVINSIEQDIFNGTNTYSGPTIINGNGTLLTVGANSSLENSSLIQLGNANAIIDLSSTPGLMRGSGQTLSGIGSIYGNVTNSTDSILSPGVGGPGTLNLYSDLTLANAALPIDLGSDPTQTGNGVNDLVNVAGNLTLSGVTTIQVTPVGPLSSATPYMIITYGGSLNGSAANLQITSSNPRYTLSVVDTTSTPGSIQISVTGVPTPLVWKGGQSPSPNVWNHTVTNFFNTGTSAYDHFYDGDLVTFDDTGVTNIVNVTETNVPGLLTLANNTMDYTFVGNGNLGGTLDKEGTGTVTLAISNALALNIITNNQGTLVLNPPVDNTLAAAITDDGSGLGTVVKAGTNMLTLNGDNSAYYGTLEVTNGTLRYTASTALGSGNFYVTNDGSLDVNNVGVGTKNIIISGAGYNGQGALVDLNNTWVYPYNWAQNVTLAGDASIGCASRFDILAGDTFNGGGFKLTKVGGSQFVFNDCGETSLGDIDVVAGELTFQQSATMGDPNKSAIVESNAVLDFWAGNAPFSKTNITVINATFGSSGGGSNALTSASTVTLQPGTNYLLAGSDFSLYGPIVGTGGFIKSGGSALWLYGDNTYSGPTSIGQNSKVIVGPSSSLGSSSTIEIDGGSTLDVSQPSSFNLGSGQTMIGNGTVLGGNINFGNGSTLAVGFSGSTYTLTVSGNLTFGAGSTNIVDVNKTTSVANDKVSGLASVTMDGTLVINNLGNVLASGDAIQLFSATNYSGGFANIIPATPGAGLAWDTSTLDNDGALRVVAVAMLRIGTATVSAGNFVLSGSGGTPGNDYSVLSQTNIAEPLSNWTVIGTGTFDGSGNFSFTNSITPETPNRFYLISVP